MPKNEPSSPQGERWQGEVRFESERFWLYPCHEKRRLLLRLSPEIDFEMRDLLAGRNTKLFADLRGQVEAGKNPTEGTLLAQRYYQLRLATAKSCLMADMQSLILQASGPAWSLSITPQGMLLDQPGQKPKALPYLEELLPGGRTSFSTEANGQRLELWVAPLRCQDANSTLVTPLTATLQVNDQTLHGCAYFGSARHE